MTSKLGKLKINDWTKGLIIAVITAVLTIIYDMLNAGSDLTTLNWKLILTTTILATLSYLLKNLGTNNKDQFLKDDK